MASLSCKPSETLVSFGYYPHQPSNFQVFTKRVRSKKIVKDHFNPCGLSDGFGSII